MRRSKKTFLSVLLTLTMILSLLPTAVLAEEAGAPTFRMAAGTATDLLETENSDTASGSTLSCDIWVNGVKFTAAGTNIPCGNGTAALDTSTSPWTLTLTNADITEVSVITTPSGNVNAAGIYAQAPLHIVLNGENTITVHEQQLPKVDSEKNYASHDGMMVKGDVIFSGDGSLSITAADELELLTGVYAEGSIYLQEGILRAENAACAVLATQDFSMDGGELTAIGTKDGVCADANVYVDGGTLTASGDYGLYASQGMYINAGTIQATGYSTGIEVGDLYVNGGNITAVSSGDVYFSGMSGIWVNGTFYIAEGTVTAENKEGALGIYLDEGDLWVDGGTITSTARNGVWLEEGDLLVSGGTLTASGTSYGVFLGSGNLDMTGGTLLTNAKGERALGICLREGDLYARGGTITTVGSLGGIYLDNGSLYADGAAIDATGGYEGICLYERGEIPQTLSISGGKVTAKGLLGIAAYGPEDQIIIEGGEILSEATIVPAERFGLPKRGPLVGIVSNGEILISGGKVTATAVSDNAASFPTGLSAYQKLSITGGEVTAEGSEAALKGEVELVLENVQVINPKNWSFGTVQTDWGDGAGAFPVHTIKVGDAAATRVEIREKATSSGGGGGGGSAASRYDVTVDADSEATVGGSISLDREKAGAGNVVTVTVTPDEGYTLESLTIQDKNGNEITLTDKGNGKYSFTMPKGDVAIIPVFAKTGEVPTEPSEIPETPEPESPFTDIAQHWAKDYILQIADQGIISGITPDNFGPDQPLDRAMLTTLLWRMEGRPAAEASHGFEDVNADAYYHDALSWAAENGIVSGITPDTFVPGQAISREQLAAILFRHAQYKGMNLVTLQENLQHFTDENKIAPYAIPALNWAVGAGIMQGTPDGTLQPDKPATRAEVTVMLVKFLEVMEAE